MEQEAVCLIKIIIVLIRLSLTLIPAAARTVPARDGADGKR